MKPSSSMSEASRRQAPAAPACLGPRAKSSTPSWRPPPGCWDTLFHVLGPQNRYPYSPTRKYTPPAALLHDYLAMLDVLGIDHAIVTHANTQGSDNTIYLDAVAQAPDRLVAVVRPDSTLTLAQARQWHQQGVRGVRFAFHGMSGVSLDRRALDNALRLLPELGWFVQLHLDDGALPHWLPEIRQWSVPVVLDHFGRVDAGEGIDGPNMRALLTLAELPHVWVRLSGFERVSRQAFPFHDLTLLTAALCDVAADRLLWGTDWPHTGHFDPQTMPDDGLLLEALIRHVPAERSRVAILRDNPRRLLQLPPWHD